MRNKNITLKTEQKINIQGFYKELKIIFRIEWIREKDVQKHYIIEIVYLD